MTDAQMMSVRIEALQLAHRTLMDDRLHQPPTPDQIVKTADKLVKFITTGM